MGKSKRGKQFSRSAKRKIANMDHPNEIGMSRVDHLLNNKMKFLKEFDEAIEKRKLEDKEGKEDTGPDMGWSPAPLPVRDVFDTPRNPMSNDYGPPYD